MRLLLFFIILIITAESADRSIKGHDVGKRNRPKCYLKEVLAVIHHTPNQLAIHKKTNTLYFSSDVSHGEYVPVILDIDTKTLTLIKGVKDAYAMTCNNLEDEVYFGGSGIKRYHAIDKTLASLAVTNLDIWWLYFKKNIYFVQFPNLNVFVYKDRTIKAVRQLKHTRVHQFVFDKEGHIYFANASGLYGVLKNSHKHILLRSQPAFLGMASDNTGEIFVSSETAIYVINKSLQKVKRVVRVSGVMAIAFDKDNHLIYSDGQELVRLLPVASEAFNISQGGRTYFCN